MVERGAIQSYKDLQVWQEAMEIAEACYLQTRAFPRDELFGLTSQIRRSAVSVATNIAEGHGREQTGSFVQFLRISQGSLKELETLVTLAIRVGVGERPPLEEILERSATLGKMLRSLIRSLQNKGAT